MGSNRITGTMASQELTEAQNVEELHLQSSCIESSVSTCAALTADGKNIKLIKCMQCPSVILSPDMATLVNKDFVLPAINKKLEEENKESSEKGSIKYWCVDNMYVFENVGFSKTVDGVKYLICADCEMGPIGYHNLETKLSYVCLSRVKHV